MFSKAKITELKARFASVDVNSIADSSLQAKARKLKKQAGFTLLELLVVVAILAAVAGTATIALQDTDARASAAAHVAMMDEMNKGIRTFRVLNKNTFPTGFDSLVQTATDDNAGLSVGTYLEIGQGGDSLVQDTLDTDQFSRLAEVGMDSLMYVSNAADPDGDGNCTATNIKALVESRQNAVVAGNVFLTANGNGCGVKVTFNDQETESTADDVFDLTSQAVGADPVTAAAGAGANTESIAIMTWNGGAERLTGQAEPGAFNAVKNTVFMAVGLGPSSNLFAANSLGGMTSVPVYRHVGAGDYNRFMAIWDIGSYDATGEIVMDDQPSLTTIVDGAGDTKEEELGEWDGSRNTI